MKDMTQSVIWRELEAHERNLADVSLRQLFEQDARRFERLSVQSDGILFDFSKQRLTEEVLGKLLALAGEAELESWRERLFNGEAVNHTERRPALHMALRGGCADLSNTVIPDQVQATLRRLERFVADVRGGRLLGFTGQTITDVVHIGIGGSDLGPRLALQALAPYADGPQIHFVSNIDGVELSECIRRLDPARTLVSIASKSFGTRETLLNGEAAKQWLMDAAGSKEALNNQVVALTGAEQKAVEFGVAPQRVFPVWSWVGGRYSLWSSVGLPVALACGMSRFQELLKGAAAMDKHFREAPLRENIPVLMALIGVWCRNFLGLSSWAVIPYSERLGHLPAYLQQLEMESNGKSVTRDGLAVSYDTVPVLWGQTGTVGQHAFFQALHQGTTPVPADFIGVARSDNAFEEHHEQLIANLFAQTEALMNGQTAAEAKAQMAAEGLSAEQIAFLLPYRVFPGNRPTSTLLLECLSPHLLGQVIALYEHKVFCQSVIWNLNAFDQWGVELGKRLADNLLPVLHDGEGVAAHDGSTQGLVSQYRRWSGKEAPKVVRSIGR
ncbi:glucose-6-phosphate isomerase [Alkalilimnicola ehrlichii]|uniref:glucose-6-phosphate isomerase n=1 Tax=Alkalilimnicola ehrlichii TaxID=351052 RepID=UPI000E2F6CCE|nr:glucose-6-phosphate isomerase [Alkalilimnicola ehrlichii]RFA30605.1 glucose-6-phosphate isomerase [Alkalilimnicola ehrlichii]